VFSLPVATKSKKSGELDQRVLKALAHPLRMSILGVLNQKVASPSDVADELGEPLANVSYHFHKLKDLGCIELVETKPRRGALEHYYRALERPFFRDQDWIKLPANTRRQLFDAVLRKLASDLEIAAKTGGFDRPDTHVSRTPIMLDEQGWTDVVKTLEAALDRVLEIQAEAANRMASGADDAVASTVGIMHFERPGQDSNLRPNG
jgi:DNA-binding transcriptional ArsR family regulator